MGSSGLKVIYGVSVSLFVVLSYHRAQTVSRVMGLVRRNLMHVVAHGRLWNSTGGLEVEEQTMRKNK